MTGTVTALPGPGEHGGDGAQLAAALGIDPAEVLDLSASLNPFAPHVAALAADHLDALGRYPDPAAGTAALVAALGTDPDRVLLTNGGAEAIALVAAHTGGTVVGPEFSLYARHLRRPGPRWRSNPNNPSGRLAPPEDEAGVWDEAFYPLATGQWTRGDADRGAIVLGSLTKLFACPGLRVGYVLADPDTIAALSAAQPRWALNGLAAAILPELLADVPLAAWATGIAERRAALTDVLAAHDLEPQPSDAPWVLCARGEGLRDRLAPHAVLVRDCASFGLPGVARVAVPDEAGLARLQSALSQLGGFAAVPQPQTHPERDGGPAGRRG